MDSILTTLYGHFCRATKQNYDGRSDCSQRAELDARLCIFKAFLQ